jgi:hypothetical protein
MSSKSSQKGYRVLTDKDADFAFAIDDQIKAHCSSSHAAEKDEDGGTDELYLPKNNGEKISGLGHHIFGLLSQSAQSLFECIVHFRSVS